MQEAKNEDAYLNRFRPAENQIQEDHSLEATKALFKALNRSEELGNL